MPMPVLATAMSRKSMSSKEPTATSRAASTTKMKLKKVKTFSRTICPTVLVGESTGSFAQPFCCRSFTWCRVSPCSGSGLSRATTRRGWGAGTCAAGCFVCLRFMLPPLISSKFGPIPL